MVGGPAGSAGSVESKLAAVAPAQTSNVTVSLPSARDLACARRRSRADRGGAQRIGPGAGGHADRLARGRPRVAGAVLPVPHKQIEDALDAVAALRDRIPGLHLDIVGGGWWHDRLTAHAERLGIADAVTFHGHVDDVTKHQVVQRCWVQLLPSRKEGWGWRWSRPPSTPFHDRLPVVRGPDRLDRRRCHRHPGGQQPRAHRTALRNCWPTTCCGRNSAARRRPAPRSSPGGRAPTRCSGCCRR